LAMHTRRSAVTVSKSAGMRLAVLAVLQALCLEPSRSEDPAFPRFDEEVVKQESIYRSERGNVPEGYVVDRSLSNYAEVLPTGFDRALAGLGDGDRWLDIGAGQGQAILDYYAPDYDLAYPEGRERRGGKARAVALSIEDRRTIRWRQVTASLGENQIKYLFNKRLREYSREELGKFQIITDVYGGFSYTHDLSLFMEKVLGLLNLNGSFYSLLQAVHLEDGKDRLYSPEPVYLTEIVDAAGRDVKVCSWLKSIACVNVTCESKSTWDSPTELIHVQKVCNDVTVPALNPLHYEAGTPPGRRFQLTP
jgi:SAM-dependent methyltransferase